MIISKRNSDKKENTNPQVSLRCWECGLYLESITTGLLCNRCLVRCLKLYRRKPKDEKEKIDSSNMEKDKLERKKGDHGLDSDNNL